MFALDERIRGLPAARDQVVALYHSINAPHLAIPGKKAGPAQAYILGLRAQQGFAVFIYLFLPESSDCAVYASDRRKLTSEEYQEEEQEAIAFCESMAFLVDNTNFRALPPDQQEELLRSAPVFLKDPKQARKTGAYAAAAQASTQSADGAQAIGRLFASF